MQIICNFAEKIALWEDHMENYDKSAEHNVRIRRIVRDFNANLNRMEEYFFHIQERYNYYATPKIKVLLSQKSKKELNESKNSLKIKINIEFIVIHLLNSNYLNCFNT